MENKIPTAKDFGIDFEHTKDNWGDQFSDVMIAFTKLHVTAALKAAAENVKTKEDIAIFAEGSYRTQVVDRESILNSYPLDNIK